MKAKLTKRQHQVIRLIVEGLTSKQIARKLELSHRTVESHRQNAYRRLGVHNVAGMIRCIIAFGAEANRARAHLH
ncbi:LuxR C-terminal-related transcriptional regulator [Bradyrhizobium sp. CCBAU 53338]|uniref:LuxR C-terminal-related transcriptional regulator n=1 Tax=Bradyrhizobium sp. CCBAU 53338 TaxID=1325111 RepID=UPI00188CBBFF|nr:helix-turn-helix transcriptional regulator [Bradyrhizobium sp. CCBAU 53338]QOZ52951.1 hypothetical protein XH90_17445 [Bradyrhizobium sp. CCBAU 53338]